MGCAAGRSEWLSEKAAAPDRQHSTPRTSESGYLNDVSPPYKHGSRHIVQATGRLSQISIRKSVTANFEIYNKETKVTNFNLSVTSAIRDVKRENSRSVETAKPAPRECSKCHYALFPTTGRCTNFECPHYRRQPGAMTVEQIIWEDALPPLYHGRKWGEWVLDTERLTLVYRGEPISRGEGSNVTEGVERYTAYLGSYEIDIERILHSAGMLDWIFQINSKGWATARVTKDLINAFDSIFLPQANLCSGGRSKVIHKPAMFLRSRIATVGSADEGAA